MTDPVARLNEALGDRYRIERELGEGGMATVYLAEDLRHQRQVAVKVLRPELAASLGPQRFIQEIEIAARLQHPHILPVHDSGEADGFLYYVMPYVEGESLRERLTTHGELPVHEAVRLLVEVADALAYAHAHNVVHRDIKPENIMVSGRHALVTDFGVAKAVSDATGRNKLTTAGVALGTPAYMAPEQASADPNIDQRVDVYALGVLGYELLSGRPPFTGGTPQQVLAAHVTAAPEPLTERRPTVSAALGAVIMKALEKRPADRWQTAEEMLARLEPLATPSGGITPAETRPTRAVVPRAHWGWRIAAIASVLVAVVAAAFVWRHRTVSPSVPARYDRVPLTTSGYATNPVVSPDGKQVAYTEAPCSAAVATHCYQRLVVQDVTTGQPLVLKDSLAAAVPTEWSSSGEWILATLLRGNEGSMGQHVISRLGGTSVPLAGPATFTPRGDTLLVDQFAAGVHGGHGTVKLYVAPWTQAVDSVLVQAPDGALLMRDMHVSPDGRWIAIEWQGTGPAAIAIEDRQGRLVAPLLVGKLHGRTLPYLWNAAGTALLQPKSINGQGLLLRTSVNPRTGAPGSTDTIPVSANALQFSRSADGAVAAYVVATDAPSDLWTLAATRPGQIPQLARKVMSGSALDGYRITPDGGTVLYAIRTAVGAQSADQWFAMPFAGGPAHPITPPIHSLGGIAGTADYRGVLAITGDSRRLVVLTTASGASSQLTSYDIATGAMVASAQRADTGWALTGAGGGDVALFTKDTLVILDDSLRESRRVTVPASVGRLGLVAVASRGSGVSALLLPANFSFRLDSRPHLPIDTLTASGEFRQVWASTLATYHWLWRERDGSLIIDATMAMNPGWALYRMPVGGGVQQRLGPVPVPDNPYVDFSDDFRRGVVLVTPTVSNIWLVRNFTSAMR